MKIIDIGEYVRLESLRQEYEAQYNNLKEQLGETKKRHKTVLKALELLRKNKKGNREEVRNENT